MAATMECIVEYEEIVTKHMDGIQGDNDSTAQFISNGISSKSFTLLKLVEVLGCHFTNQEAGTRGRATLLLADVLHELPTDFLNTQEVDMLQRFFCEKLDDHFTIQPHALAGLLALSYQSCLPIGSVHEICHSIFRHVHTQSLSQGHRMQVYTLFLNFLTNHLNAMQEMGADFTCGFIQAMEGEKDPRNLMLAFRCATLVASRLPLGTFTEELFEIVSCYFPIDFHPPPSDTSGITKEVLVNSLRTCMASTSKFAPFCLPLLYEKIDSDIQTARLDAFSTLAACAAMYTPNDLNAYLEPLFTSIKKEVYNEESPALVSSALSALTSMVQTLTPTTQQGDKGGALEKFLDHITIECHGNIADPMSSLLSPSCRIFEVTMATSTVACSKIVHGIAPLVTQKLEENLQAEQKKKMVDVLVRLLEAASQLSQSENVASAWAGINFYEILTSACRTHNTALISSSLKAVCHAISINCQLTNQEILADEFLNIFSKNDGDTRLQTVACLRKLSEKSPDLTRSRVVPRLKTLLLGDSGDETVLPAMDAVAAMSTHSDIVRSMSPVLRDLLTSDSLGVRDHATKTLGELLAANLEKVDIVDYYNDEIVPYILETCRDRSRVSDPATLDNVGEMLRLLATHLDTEKSRKLRREIYDLTFNNGGDTVKSDPSPMAISRDDNHLEKDLSVLLGYTFAGCSPEDLGCFPLFLDQLFDAAAANSTQSSICLSYSKLYGALLNKLPPGLDLDNRLTEISMKLTSANNGDVCLTNGNAVILWSWVSKALIIRAHPLAEKFIDCLIACLRHEVLGTVAADGFHTIVTDDRVVLNKRSGAIMKYLHKQRAFEENVEKITNGFTKAPEGCRGNYLLALLHILQPVPQSSLQPYMPRLLPLLLQSLDMDGCDLLLRSLTTLSHIQSADVVINHARSLVTKLLRLSRYETSMMVRVKALECLRSLSRLPYPSLHLSQKVVIKSLETALNDRKRLVRDAAAKTRQKWFLLGSS